MTTEKRYDAVIIGAGRVGRRIARALGKKRKTTAIITLPGDPEDRLHRAVTALMTAGPSWREPEEEMQADLFPGPCRFINPRTVLTADGLRLIGRNFVLATGAAPNITLPPDHYPLCHETWETPTTPPEHTVVIGAGPLGVASAMAHATQGRRVTLVEEREAILPEEEPEIANAVLATLTARGIDTALGARVTAVERDGGRLRARLADGQTHLADHVIAATGLCANTSGLDLQKAGVYVDGTGRIAPYADLRTTIPAVWAAGACTAPPFNIAVEEHQADTVSNNAFAPLFGRNKRDIDPAPVVLPLNPPLARVGLGESAARATYRGVKSATLVFSQGAHGETGVIKIVARRKTGAILGVHALSPDAPALIHAFNLAIRAGIPLFDLGDRLQYPAPGTPDAARHCVSLWLDL